MWLMIQQLGTVPRILTRNLIHFPQNAQRRSVMSSRLPMGVPTRYKQPALLSVALISPVSSPTPGRVRPVTLKRRRLFYNSPASIVRFRKSSLRKSPLFAAHGFRVYHPSGTVTPCQLSCVL